MCVDTTSSSESNSSVACTHRSRCLASRAHEAYTRVHRKDYPPMGPTSALAAPSVPAWQELGCTLWIARESRPLRKYNQSSGQLAPLVQPEGKTSEVLCGSRETAKKIRLTTLPASGHWERPIDVLLYPVSETPRPAPCIDNKRKSSRNDLMCVVPSESRRGNLCESVARVTTLNKKSRRSRSTSPSASLSRLIVSENSPQLRYSSCATTKAISALKLEAIVQNGAIPVPVAIPPGPVTASSPPAISLPVLPPESDCQKRQAC
jgi:hypothetical protein